MAIQVLKPKFQIDECLDAVRECLEMGWTGMGFKTVEFEDPEIAKIMDEYEKSMPLPKMVETSNFWVQLEIAFTKVWNGGDPDQILMELSDTIGAQIEQIKANLPTQESFSAGAGGFVK